MNIQLLLNSDISNVSRIDNQNNSILTNNFTSVKYGNSLNEDNEEWQNPTNYMDNRKDD